ncbi:MAG: FAD-dependent oxidoreductase, partial [Faecalibacillus sp.]
CPLGISPQGYLGLTKIGKYQEAYDLIWKKNPLLSVCARVCHHPCELGCKRGILVDEPIKIREIKRYLSEKVDYNPKPYVTIYDEKVAVIGAGPAGLTCGHYLSLLGYDVTIYEESTEAGGMLTKGIPEFRLDRDVVRKEIQKLENAGLQIQLGTKINQNNIEELKTEYDAIVVAAGTPRSKELYIEGWRLAGVMTAMDFMERINNKQNMRRHLGQLFPFVNGDAVIIGGGSVAVDCARTALRVGAKNVTVVCLEQGSEVPAHQWEIDEAKEEGIQFIEGYSPVEFTCELFPTLTGVNFEKVKSMSKNENGQLIVETDKNETLHVSCQWVVQAIGQNKESLWNDINEDGIFFAGDISSNKCSVVDAMASGKNIAYEVDSSLRGRQLKISKQGTERLQPAPVGEKLFPYNFRKVLRPETPKLKVEDRIHHFAEVEKTLNDEEAFIETDSCLGCGYSGVDTSKCLGCGLCQQLCPKGDVITMVAKGGDE